MSKTKNENLTKNAQSLRNRMTKEERHLWYDFLKNQPQTINRQKVIDHYIIDFYCAEKRLAIELDGSQHYETENREDDKVRDAKMKELGITVLRYTNYQVDRQFESVCADIKKYLEK